MRRVVEGSGNTNWRILHRFKDFSSFVHIVIRSVGFDKEIGDIGSCLYPRSAEPVEVHRNKVWSTKGDQHIEHCLECNGVGESRSG